METGSEMALTRVLGENLLGEVEEMNLDKLLTTLRRTAIKIRSLRSGIVPLDALLAARTTPHLSLAGRFLPLLHALASHLVTAQRQTLIIIDPLRLFDPTALEPGAARHVYVLRPPTDEFRLSDEIERARKWMIYGGQCGQSADREFWGALVVGAKGGEVSSGWHGWARVVRADDEGDFAVGVSVEEALGARDADAWQEDKGWVVRSEAGGFWFGAAGFGMVKKTENSEQEPRQGEEKDQTAPSPDGESAPDEEDPGE